MSMDLTFLGTGSAYPSPSRGASALVLRYEGDCWLFDCGEGTQTQFMKSQLKAGRICKIFITHLHGDHLFGLPGLLCTVSLQASSNVNKQQPVDIYGPVGLRKFLRMSMEISQPQLLYPYAVHEIVPTRDQCPAEEFRELSVQEEGLHPQEVLGKTISLSPGENSYTLIDNEQFLVKAFRLYHRIPSFGFVVEEKERPGKLQVQKLKELGIPPGPLYGKLKNGESIVLENGVTVSPSAVLEESIPGRKVCLLGDCSGVLDEAALKLCHGADVLVHEATLDDSQMDKAKEYGHSTPSMAAAFAKSCRAEKLILSHFSQRYKPSSVIGDGGGDDDDVTELKRQAELVFDCKEVTLAEDFMVIEIPMKKRK
ncbi:zinc phosphodiesterase ELAC protein 1 isoform X1 [Latimeria chalumnae]|uniref:ElaC ribonuclease Z 1 n=1 Tax=Latimeria chalumnae TaxID=7897 RepID=H3B9L6_LATCH|nr:PREDICTED: zinc phosphodiesterase ELAC protein 1 isoform X1 [Latimeria chalumnae]XP_005995230.1 PREDICTED: zinc phosphodiesterase ELAC protein 1 isoform X1 [Latimeria chalumnae]XP_005995231.1 PREDICTED: zinc phosphodiesterase ELAC protein 1 isoform X1 [Latimeria chalumnae]|eukprot:XP_005995229.1 PREDICTED: zinc phosphodiesterase ELAC protein 1 isoform X1 [Latimeria chalumnae]